MARFDSRLGGIVCLALLALAASASVASAAEAGAPFNVSPSLREVLEIPEHGRILQTLVILIQLAVVLAAAKLLGALSERIGVPGVIGELLAGVLIGPFVLGSLIQIPLHGHWVPLFPRPTAPGQWPVNEVLWSFAQVASIILLFVTGLHTDLKQFLRYVGPASIVAVVGILAPFLLGVAVVYIPAFAALARPEGETSVLIPALFVGAILAATSIGITARVLSDLEKLETPEGVTILGAAVLDDVLGIIALAIVGGIAATGTVSAAAIAGISLKAFGVWFGLTAAILLLARPIERFFTGIRYPGAMVALALGLAFICSAIAEFFNLAFIIGAYSVGLGLSRTRMAHRLMDELKPISDFIVPIFFATLGMLVNFDAMLSDWRVIVFGLVVTAAAVVGKLVGCGLAALPAGFNAIGAYRVGLGMLPRGEVALIVAGIGLSRGIIGQNVFGVSILMTLLTTLVAPILLVRAFRAGGTGRRDAQERSADLPPAQLDAGLLLRVPPDMGRVLVSRLLDVAEQKGWEGSYERSDEGIYLLRQGADAAQVQRTDDAIRIDASGARQEEFRAFLAEVQKTISADAAAPIEAQAS